MSIEQTSLGARRDRRSKLEHVFNQRNQVGNVWGVAIFAVGIGLRHTRRFRTELEHERYQVGKIGHVKNEITAMIDVAAYDAASGTVCQITPEAAMESVTADDRGSGGTLANSTAHGQAANRDNTTATGQD